MFNTAQSIKAQGIIHRVSRIFKLIKTVISRQKDVTLRIHIANLIHFLQQTIKSQI